MATLQEILAEMAGLPAPPPPASIPPALPLAPRRMTLGGVLVPPPVPRVTLPPTMPIAPSLAGEESMGQTPPSAPPPARGPFGSQQLPPDFRSQEPPAPFPSVDDLRAGFVPAPPIMTPQGIGPWQTTVTPESDANAVAAGKMPTPASSEEPPTPPPGIGYAMPERTGVGEDRLVAPSTPPPTTPPPGGGGGPPMRRAPSLWDYIDTALAGMAGGSPVLSRLGDQFAGRNATYDAVLQRGATPELARAIAMNPQQFATVLPTLFSPRTSIVNNRLVDARTGQLLADFSDRFAPLAEGAGVLNTATGEVRGGTGLPRPPAGFEWADPNDRSKGLRAIPGGPGTHIPAETAGRLALMRTARTGVIDARRTYERAWGATDLWRQFWANTPGVGDVGFASGEQGMAQRSVRTAVEAALRVMTGAAAPEQEVRRYADMFTPNARDTVESAKQKMNALETFMSEAEAMVTQGRTSSPPGTAGAAPGGGGGGGWTDIAPGIRIRPVR